MALRRSAATAVTLLLLTPLPGAAAASSPPENAPPPPPNPPGLLKQAPLPAPALANASSGMLRQRLAAIDRDAVDRACFALDQKRLQLNLFDDAAFIGVIRHLDRRSAEDFTVSGRLEGEPGGSFVVAIVGDAVVGNIWSPARGTYQLRTHPTSGLAVVQQIDQSQLGGCACGPQQEIELARPPAGGQPEGGTQDCPPLVQALVVYTPQVLDAMGGEHAVRAFIHATIASANIAYQNSNVATRLHLARQAQVHYIESGQITTDLVRLRSPGDGFLDEAIQWRDQFGADVVSLIVSNAQACGIGYIMVNPSPAFATFAFSVVHQDCALTSFSFAHEVGHHFGCGHDWGDASSAAFPYSHGLRFIGESGEQWRTVMAAAPGVRMPFFSNPDVLYDGTPTGIPEGEPQPADNARTINNTFPVVAGFRAPAMIDCNANGNPDGCDIVQGLSLDTNDNGVPDECDSPPCPPDVIATLAAADAQSFDQFGIAVGIGDDRVIIGADRDDDGGQFSGSAYIFRSESSRWIQEAKLVAGDPFSFKQFGHAVAISPDGQVAIVGAFRDGFLLNDVGAVYVFTRSGTQWTQQMKIDNPDPEQSDWFGWSVALMATAGGELRAVIGAPLDNEANVDAGAAYIYTLRGNEWIMEAKIMADNAQPLDRLGFAVGASPDGRIIIGSPLHDAGAADGGAAHIFKLVAERWTHEATLLPPQAMPNDRFGSAVSIHGDRAIIGSNSHPQLGLQTGAAWVFQAAGGDWQPQAKLVAADGSQGEQFGAAVSIAGDVAVIGSILDSVNGAASGSAFIFHRDGSGQWAQQAKISAPAAAPYDNFGIAVAISPDGMRAVAGAYFDDHHDTVDGGSAHVFDLSAMQRDCNGNGAPDACDIANGVSRDENHNGIPDECEEAPCPADVSGGGGDGVVDINDLLAVLGAWGPCPPPPSDCVADITGDGLVDIDDVLEVIGAWGPCR